MFELKLNRFPRWRELDALIVARNIVAHGLGTLTRKQVVRGVAKEGIANKLALLDIKLDGLDLVVNERQVHRCAALVVEFITWLDSHPEAQRHRWEARAS